MLQVRGQALQLRLGRGRWGGAGAWWAVGSRGQAVGSTNSTEFLCHGPEISAVASSSAEELRREGYAGAELEKRKELGQRS